MSASVHVGASHTLAFLIAAAFFPGCVPSSPTEAERVRQGVRTLAPEGGTGTKTYNYPSGTIKQRCYWNRFELTKIEYYDLTGRRVYTAVPTGRRALLLTMGDDGTISELYEATDFVMDGHCFVFEDGRLHSIKMIRYGECDSEAEVHLFNTAEPGETDERGGDGGAGGPGGGGDESR